MRDSSGVLLKRLTRVGRKNMEEAFPAASLLPPMSAHYKRRKKLINPRLQLRMSGVFVGLATLMLLLQFGLITATLLPIFSQKVFTIFTAGSVSSLGVKIHQR